MKLTTKFTQFISLLIALSVNTLTFAQEGNTLSFSVIVTANSGGAQEAMVVDGGGWLTQRKLVHTAVLVKHPKGDFLWDSGIGSEAEGQMEAFSFWEKQLFKIENVKPAAQQLKDNNYPINQLMAIIPSHMHWDHVSGIEDFPGTPIWLQKQEHEGAKTGQPPAFIQSQFDSEQLEWQYLELSSIPYQGFARSLDLFKDGRVILVDLSGHTLGQLGMFLNTDQGSFFFIGDTTWALEGVTNNRSRPVFVNWLMSIDHDADQNASAIQQIHNLSLGDSNIKIVPAHDERVTAELPQYPDFL